MRVLRLPRDCEPIAREHSATGVPVRHGSMSPGEHALRNSPPRPLAACFRRPRSLAIVPEAPRTLCPPTGTDLLRRLPTREPTMIHDSFARRITTFASLGAFITLAMVSAVRAADEPCNYPPKSAIGPDGWINLFDGKDFKGWKLSDSKGSRSTSRMARLSWEAPRPTSSPTGNSRISSWRQT